MALIAFENPGGGRVRDLTPPRPEDLVSVPRKGGGTLELHSVVAAQLAALQAAARRDGIAAPLLLPVSGYRSVKRQTELWRKALARYGSTSAARRWVAPPGHSAHQTGRAIDFYLRGSNSSGGTAALRRTQAWKWLDGNARRFGFYPYSTEPWHWEYNPPGAGGIIPAPIASLLPHTTTGWLITGGIIIALFAAGWYALDSGLAGRIIDGE